MGFFDPGVGMIADALRGSPKMPAWQTIDPAKEQGKAITANQNALPGIEKLAGDVNLFNQKQIEQMLSNSIPNYAGLKSGISTNIEALLKGEIPSDVSDAISRSGAAHALGGGYGGSGMHGDLVARDLGRTSLDLTQQGISSAEKWIGTMAQIEQPGMFNMASMFLTPAQVTATDTNERDSKFQYDWGKNMLDWQSSFGYSMANEIQTDSAQFNQMAGSVLGHVAGGAMGGMG